MNEFEINIPKIADILISQCSLFNCSLEDGWKNYMHPALTEQVDFEDVINYIKENIELGKLL
jgi:hypothetical protein